MAEIELDRDPVVGKVDRLVHDHKALVHGLAESVAHFTDLACTFESMRQTSEVFLPLCGVSRHPMYVPCVMVIHS